MGAVGRTVAWSGLVGTLLVLLLLPRTHDRVTTYATASPRLAAADVLATLAVVAACIVGLLVQPSRAGLVPLVLAGMVWTLPNWTGWDEGPDLARSVGLALSPLLAPLLVHVVLGAAGRARRVRPALIGWYTAAGVVSLAHALMDDPFDDPSCWNSCLVDNVFLLGSEPDLVRGVDFGWLLVSACGGAVLAVTAVAWWATASSAGRRMRAPALIAAAALGAVLVGQSVLRWQWPRADPTTSGDASLYLALAAVVVLVAGAWAYGPLLDRWTRLGVARLVTGLGSASEAGTVARVLASATGDSGVRLVYRLPSSGGYADVTGRRVDAPVPGPGVTPVLRDDQELATVLHDADTADSESVAASCGPAVLLALDNERLRAEGLAQLADVRASRARVVETGDAERRQLERNLHDGAQQRMLALSFDLRRAATAATDPHSRDLLAAAEGEARLALTELRDLAHGIHPAVLDEAGLAVALATLAEGAPVPVGVRGDLGARPPRGAERTAYVVVRDAVAAAATAGSELVTVTLTETEGDLVVDVVGAGPGPFVAVEDRVAAGGGHVEVSPDRLRAVIPCG